MNNQKKTNIQELMVISLKFQISNFEQIKFSPNFYKLPCELPNPFFKEFLDFFISFSSFQSVGFFPVSNAERVLDVSRRSIIWGGVRTKDNLLQYRCRRSSLFTLLPKSAKHNVSTNLGWKTAAIKKLSNGHRRWSRSPPECRRRWREMRGWFVQSFATVDNLTMPFGAGSKCIMQKTVPASSFFITDSKVARNRRSSALLLNHSL